MRVLHQGRWQSGYCAYHRHPGQLRIRVGLWLRAHAIEDAYVIPPRSLRTVFDYVREIGLFQTLRKIRSRLRERGRNRKFVACGWGRIAEVGADDTLCVGDAVMFVAPFHPACVDEVCLEEDFIRSTTWAAPSDQGAHAVLEGDWSRSELPWRDVAAWSQFSGRPVDSEALDRIFEALRRVAATGFSGLSWTRRETEPETEPEDAGSVAASSSSTERPSAVLFGLGHYAKNIVLPRLSPHVSVDAIHEIDPTQIGPMEGYTASLRTSAFPDERDTFDVYLVAGYHHTHAPLAIEALRRSSDVVVEKPLATTREQLDRLLAALSESEGRLFTAFQRRYTRMNDWLVRDLEIDANTPVHGQAVVYEIPLPKNHWYRWPSSGSRIVSNGCHWIDHFLYLNRFTPPRALDVSRLDNGDVVVTVELENGAAWCLTITEHGSSRLGVREHVHYRTASRTATIVDQRHYASEASERTLRRKSISLRESFDRMYSEIGRRIRSGEPGDSLRSVEISAGTVLSAESLLAEG